MLFLIRATSAIVLLWAVAGCGGDPTVVTTEDGEEVTVSQSGDGVDVTIANDSGGQTRIQASSSGLSLPDEWPDDLETLPGIKVMTTATTPQGLMVSLESPKSSSETIAFHEQKLRDAGWEIQMNMKQPNGGMLNATKGERSVNVVVSTSDETTAINIVLGSK
ncbi:hypothetical protein Enr13x_53830 [Stieleria neptunia]|uniref:Preprotein translocase subunit SecD n=1 Tax=Stieleria neptunia TaxID=2527979 RepID=A0A518HXM8_9BACT|nr:hypothetical protein [Stieleria neptunia]QDV45504.1 hypothetical protein Enr13x_53830 [Stieleria neptunia]